MPIRRPRGYFGEDHTTLGSDILAVLKILKMPEQVLGKAEADRLKTIEADGWYPIEWLLGLMELFQLSHKERVLQVAKSARDILYGIDGMYHHANRGRGIGGWKVLKFEPGLCEIEKNTAHHCVMEHGILTEALATTGCACNVTQTRCFRDGFDTCIYEVTCAFVDQRWSGDPNKR